MLASVPGMRNVRTDLTNAKTMLKVDVDAVAAANVGMVQAQIGQAVTQAIRGTKVGTVTVDDTTVDVILRSRERVTTVEVCGRSRCRSLRSRPSTPARLPARQSRTTRRPCRSRPRPTRDAAVASQLSGLRESRTKVSETISSLTSQLAALNAQLAQLSALPPGTVTVPPVDPIATLRAQIAQLSKSIETAKAQLTATDESIDKVLESKAKTAQSRADSEALSQAAKDAQKAKATPVLLDAVADVTEVFAGLDRPGRRGPRRHRQRDTAGR